ncbi:MAG: DUF1570 domain-containing protein [Planctomycetaceae bacterium]|nr:DUF1570 domain-containing protein [Planctomycetaceae bacterium]
MRLFNLVDSKFNLRLRVRFRFVFLILSFIFVTINLTGDVLFSQYNSQPVLLTPNTNDLDGLSSLRAITSPTNAIPESYNSRPVDRNYRQYDDRQEYPNRQYQQYDQDNFRQDLSRDQFSDQSNYRNNNYSGDYISSDRELSSRNNTQKVPDNYNYQREVQRDNLQLERDRVVGNQRDVKTATAYPALMDAGLRGGDVGGIGGGVENRVNSADSDIFSSNRVVSFGGVVGGGGSRELQRGVGGKVEELHDLHSGEQQVIKKLDLTPSYKDELPFVRVCGVVVVQANFPLSEVELQLLEIENLQRDLNNYLGLPAPKEKIELCLFRDETSYTKFLASRFPNAPRDRRALYVKKNNSAGTVLVQRLKNFEIDLRHEMTHAIVHASIPVVPIWLDEGLAKYFEPLPQDRFNDNPYLNQVKRNMRFGAFAVPSLGRLEKLSVASDMGDSEYRDSWAWVHFMFHHSEKTHRLLAGYLKLLATLPQEKYRSKDGTVKVPNLSLYIDDYVENPRQQFRKHFQNNKNN